MNREQLSKYKKNKRDIENLDGIIAKQNGHAKAPSK